MDFEVTPDEQYLRDAFRDGAAVKKDVSMAVIGTPDISLQARVQHLNSAHVERLRESLREVGSLRAIATFRDHGTPNLWLADGFHRHEAYRLEGRDSIPCHVIEGGYREALKFATMCNRENCLGRTREDEKKAVFLLFADPEWSKKSNRMIAEHVGVGVNTVHRWRGEYCQETKTPPPDFIETPAGYMTKRPCSPVPRKSKAVQYRSDKRTRHDVKIVDRADCLPHGFAVVICRTRPKCSAAEVAKQIGVVFMTPEELIESLR